MNEFYADEFWYIDLSKIVTLQQCGTTASKNRYISITLLNNYHYAFHENFDSDYKIFKALEEWHNKKKEELK